MGCEYERSCLALLRWDLLQGRLDLFGQGLNKERVGVPTGTVIDMRCTATELRAGLHHVFLIALPACLRLLGGENEAERFLHAVGHHALQRLSEEGTRVTHPHVDR